MLQKNNSLFLVFTLLAAVIGSICGYYYPELMRSINFIGKLYFHGLKILVIPFVVSIIIVGIASMGSIKKVYRSLYKLLGYFLATSLLAVLIGYLITFLIQPGYLVTSESAQIPQELASELNSFSFTRLLSSLLPENLATSIASGQIIGLIIISVFFAIALIHVGNKSKPVLDFFTTLCEILKKMIIGFLYITPLAVFSLIGASVANHLFVTRNLFNLMMIYSITMLIGFLVFGFIILPLILKFLGKKPILSFYKQLIPSASIAFASASVVAALPITYENVVERNKVDNRAGSFVLPLASVFNMNGTAIFLSIAAIFIAQLFNVSLSPIQYVILTIGCIGVAFFSSLIPYASLLMLGLVLNFADFPLHALAGIGLLLTVDWLFERLRALLNLMGDAVGSAVIGDSFDFKTAKVKRLKTPHKPSIHKGHHSKERKKSPAKKKESRKKSLNQYTAKPKPEKVVKKTTSSKPKLPPAPFHLLETELKPKETKTENSKMESSPNNKSLPESTIERERAKVTAQLAKIKERENITASSVFETIKNDNKDNGLSKIDFIAEDDKIAEKATEDFADIKETNIEKPVSFGRGKSRRGPSTKSEKSESKEKPQDDSSNEVQEDKPLYTTENVSFGRTKKKK